MSYYTQADIEDGRLDVPSSNPMFADLDIDTMRSFLRVSGRDIPHPPLENPQSESSNAVSLVNIPQVPAAAENVHGEAEAGPGALVDVALAAYLVPHPEEDVPTETQSYPLGQIVHYPPTAQLDITRQMQPSDDVVAIGYVSHAALLQHSFPSLDPNTPQAVQAYYSSRMDWDDLMHGFDHDSYVTVGTPSTQFVPSALPRFRSNAP